VYLAAVGLATPQQAFVWQGATYLAWLPPAMALAWLVARVGRPWPARLALFLPATLLHGAASAAITWLVFRARLAPEHAFGPWLAGQVLATFPVEALHYWALVALLAGVEMQRALRERERAAARLETELAQAHLATLRARLQPHFLFNTLQSIALLIPREPVVAQRMTVHLGDLLRAAFARNDAPECTLGDELALVRAYLAIEAQRFRDRLTIRWDVDDAPLDARVPDLLLQPLVENALRHGLWPRPGRGTLGVRAWRADGSPAGTRLVIEVEDDGAGLPPDWADGLHDGTGLGATRARLLALYGAEASLRVQPAPGRGTRVTVTLPLAPRARPAPPHAGAAHTAEVRDGGARDGAGRSTRVVA
jgi:signal transduction histidine kinase